MARSADWGVPESGQSPRSTGADVKIKRVNIRSFANLIPAHKRLVGPLTEHTERSVKKRPAQQQMSSKP